MCYFSNGQGTKGRAACVTKTESKLRKLIETVGWEASGLSVNSPKVLFW